MEKAVTKNNTIKTYPIKLKIPDDYFEPSYYNQDIPDNDTDIIKDYPTLSLSYVKKYINAECYAYALKNNNLCDLEDSFGYLQRLYRPISIENIKIGDIITYYNIEKNTKGLNEPNDTTIEHFAIVTDIIKTNRLYIRIKSKWGLNGIFEGSYNLLPEFYGNTFSIWRKKK